MAHQPGCGGAPWGEPRVSQRGGPPTRPIRTPQPRTGQGPRALWAPPCAAPPRWFQCLSEGRHGGNHASPSVVGPQRARSARLNLGPLRGPAPSGRTPVRPLRKTRRAFRATFARPSRPAKGPMLPPMRLLGLWVRSRSASPSQPLLPAPFPRVRRLQSAAFARLIRSPQAQCPHQPASRIPVLPRFRCQES